MGVVGVNGVVRDNEALFFDSGVAVVDRHREALFDLKKVIVGNSTHVVVELRESRVVVIACGLWYVVDVMVMMGMTPMWCFFKRIVLV